MKDNFDKLYTGFGIVICAISFVALTGGGTIALAKLLKQLKDENRENQR